MDIEKIKAREINALIDKLMQWNAFHDMPGETCRLSPDEVGTAIVALERHVAALSPALVKEGVVVPLEIIAFLRGEGPLNGKWFGDIEEETGFRPYWWRRHLPPAPASVQEQKT